MSARADILERIASALRDHPAVEPVPRAYRSAGTLDRAALVEQLVDRLVDYKANVFVVAAADAPAQLATLLAGVSSYVVPHGLDEGLLAAVDGPVREVDSPERRLDVAGLDAVDAVVTGAAVAVSETGTIMLDGSDDQGRRIISLVPDRHICLLRASDIVQILPEAIARLDATRPQTWISGPSATSDIELERVEGVHGPRTLDVLILT
ncbi:LutC/YkgG family protein [Arthrobacter sp. 35W]|uniref:LutC/YkgG family protein n=1 Tax=Arthrobacter sp. 35W TaxID=1132441 RepID=UPI000416240E|nr:LUD domain-containing protein [Arthrobacter sp. 35W]